MVLESLFRVPKKKNGFATLLVVSFVVSSFGIWFPYYVFPESASVLSLAFITIAFVPLIHRIFKDEEQKECVASGSSFGFLFRHSSLVKVYLFIFLGIVFSYSFWFVVLPSQDSAVCQGGLECFLPAKESVFREQIRTIEVISGSPILGKATGVGVFQCKDPKTASLWGCTEFIFLNNALVLGLAVLFSFVWGAGAIFLLGWNASVIGIFLGNEATLGLGSATMLFLGYLPHGTFEVMGYFIGAIAGGIISVAVTKRRYGKHDFAIIARDAFTLLIIAYWFILIGSFFEAYFIVSSVV
jgi:hypothetical protein